MGLVAIAETNPKSCALQINKTSFLRLFRSHVILSYSYELKTQNSKLKKNGLIAAGVANIAGALGCSRFFSNTAINEADLIVMSNFGLLMIVIWGLAYIGASNIQANIKWLAGAFAVEKLVYVCAWLYWQFNNDLSSVYADEIFAGVFYSI